MVIFLKKIYDYLSIEKKLNESGVYLPYTVLIVNLLIVFFLIQIDIIHSYITFIQLSRTHNKLERTYAHAIYDLKIGNIPLQSNVVKYYNDTKIIWDIKATTSDEFFIKLTSSNSRIKKHVVQFKYKKNENQISGWID